MPVSADDARHELLTTLLEKVRDDPYPSTSMLDLIESLLRPEEQPAYVMLLQDKIRAERFPSTSLLNRLAGLVAP